MSAPPSRAEGAKVRFGWFADIRTGVLGELLRGSSPAVRPSVRNRRGTSFPLDVNQIRVAALIRGLAGRTSMTASRHHFQKRSLLATIALVLSSILLGGPAHQRISGIGSLRAGGQKLA